MTEMIGWRHVRRVFAYNLILFSIFLGGLLSLIAAGSGYSSSDFREDLPYGIGLTLFVAMGMGIYVASLYRKAWNRRARYLAGAGS